jgi:hypothetical protein
MEIVWTATSSAIAGRANSNGSIRDEVVEGTSRWHAKFQALRSSAVGKPRRGFLRINQRVALFPNLQPHPD